MNKEKLKFLVVEDNELDLEKIVRGFKKLNAHNEIIHAKDGIEALEILRGTVGVPPLRGPCVVLLDLNMPRMNGLEMLHEIRDDKSLAHLPVIIVTTSNRASDIETAYSRCASGYLVKPMKTKDMYDSLADLRNYWERCELSSKAP